MIAKHVPMNSARVSNYAKLISYITGPQGKSERVGTITITNCKLGEAEVAALEVMSTQAQNKRSSADKTYHLIVSFPANDLLDEKMLKVIEDRICAALGFAEHQRISVVHHDTDNLHIHIAINKIHPTRYTIHEPYNAYHTLGRVCGAIENEYGLEKTVHRANKTSGENRAADMERHANVESLLGWIKRECQGQIQAATSWKDMHQALSEFGLRIHERANGLVISTESGLSVKASSVNRAFSKKKLEQRLGDFEAPPMQPMPPDHSKRYEEKPLRSGFNTVELYARYKREQQQSASSRTVERAKASKTKARLIENAKRAGRLRRAVIKLSNASRLAKKAMYAVANKTLRNDIAAINKQYESIRKSNLEMYSRQTWGDWLRRQATAGDEDALSALRSRSTSTNPNRNTIIGSGTPAQRRVRARLDSVTKAGTIIFSAGDSVVRDDGTKLKISPGANQAALLVALRMAMERYGDRIAVNGTSEFKDQIVKAAVAANLPVSFDDGALELRRQKLTQQATKESKHGLDFTNHKDNARGADRSRNKRDRQAAAGRAASAARSGQSRSNKPTGTRTYGNKPHTQRAGTKPPPEALNHLREMSQLGVVRIASGGEVLLPGHVPGHLEHNGSKQDPGMRRGVPGPGRIEQAGAGQGIEAAKPNIGRTGKSPPPASRDRLRPLSQLGEIHIGTGVEPAPPTNAGPNRAAPRKPKAVDPHPFPLRTSRSAIAAAEKYILEREQKRIKGFDIPKHAHYTFIDKETAIYMGTRHIDEQALALLKVGTEVMVLPVDEDTALRLKRMPVGQQVTIDTNGSIKSKGVRR